MNTLLKIVGVSTSLCVAVLGWLLYTPLPEGTTDPGATQFMFGFLRMLALGRGVREFLGYGSFGRDVRYWQSALGEGKLWSQGAGDVDVSRTVIEGVHVIIYRPLPPKQRSPAIVYFHGGGWAIQSATTHDMHTYEYAKRSRAIVFSVDYRNAPQHAFPHGLNDCISVTKYVLSHGKKYSIDVDRVGVAGDSAGGNLAAAVAYKLRDDPAELPPLLFQVLHVPALQAINLRMPCHMDNDTPVLSVDAMAVFIALYLGIDGPIIDEYTKAIRENRHISPEIAQSKYMDYLDSKLLPKKYRRPRRYFPIIREKYDEKLFNRIHKNLVDPLFAPLMADDLSGLPPTFIHVGEVDILRDDGLHFARRLSQAKVKVKLHVTPGGFHTDYFMGLPKFLITERNKKTMNETFTFIKKQFGDK